MDEYLVHNKSFLRLLEEYKKHGSLCIGVDYDGTLFDYHGNGSTYNMVKDLVRELHLLGCKIIIWTANKDLVQVEKHLIEINFPYHGINIDGINLGWESRKPFFNALLDDRSGLIQMYTELKLLVEIINKENEN